MNTTPNLEVGIANIQSSLDQINESIRGLLMFQQFATNEINSLKNKEGTSQRGNNNGGGQYGRLTKLEFSKFNGEDVQGWLYKVHQFFKIDHIKDDSHKIRLVSMYMFDKALNWHKQFVRRFGENVGWDKYEREIKIRFDSVYEDPMMELKNLKQTTTVQVYHDLFKALMNKVELTESYAISLFIGGLKDEIGMAVRMFKPTKLTDVYCLAKMQEQTIVVSKSRHAPLLLPLRPALLAQMLTRMEVIGTDVEEDGDLLLSEEGVVNTFHSLENLSLDVSVANGNVMTSIYKCKGFTWVFQGVTYTADVMILPLGGCDIVLGIQWLATLGSIQWNFKTVSGRGKNIAELLAMSVCVYPATLLKMEINGSVPESIAKVLKAYESVFEVPKGLPPKRSHDHTIPLIPNTSPINIRPYRHPPNQKDAMELMVKELLDSVVIRNSQTHFSSHIVMVKKKDGSWRMCIDYRQLNKHTVKDKFPIPVIEELIDELSRAKVFSKLDLRSSKSLQDHVQYLDQVLAVMRTHSLFAKLSKCTFVTNMVEYLGHIISDKGISTDSSKIQAMQDWPIPQNIKQLRGFLEAHKSFSILKQAMLQTPVLALLDFQKTFVVETDASGKGGTELNSLILTSIASDLLQQVKDSWTNDSVLQVIIQQLKDKSYVGDKYSWVDGILRRKDKIVVGNVVQLRNNIIKYYHSDATCAHSGTTVTVHRLKSLFYWKGKHKMVKQFIRECDTCQRQKPDIAAYLGYLQTLPIPNKTWSSISMDFIKGLPSSQDKTVVMVIVDRLSKYAHFMALQHPFTASTIAQVFLDNVYKLHVLPESIISDRDKVLLSHFWQSLFKVLKVQLKLSNAYHPQTDGQTEVVNRCLECYLRCMTSEKPTKWVQWLALVKFWYNTNFHTAIQTTSFEAMYGQKPLIHAPYMPGESVVETVDRTLKAREQALSLIKFHLARAQDRMRSLANKHKTYKVIDIDTVAYKLDLPDNSQVRHVFHVSQLKLCKGSANKMGMLPHCGPNGLLTAEPIAILDRRMKKVNNRVAVYVLVKWSNHTDEDATWELYSDLLQRFPDFKESS
ncbi:reverse transcriptase [Tanacetum coccineum]|uniref:Reverse transcriptase n=1 Tax=Tanacetum coccineum TaxID=301880 RepID=A0ABQ5EP13_9ASTR